MYGEKKTKDNTSLERTDFKLVLNNHLGKLSRLSFDIMDRETGGYYPNMDKFSSGLDGLRFLLKSYWKGKTDFKTEYKKLKDAYETKEKTALTKIAGKKRKELAHGLQKESRAECAAIKYNYLMEYLGNVIELMAANDLLLEEQDYDDEIT